ncbi:hypothetical protein ACES2L_01625 [Bdellovibrio bacteriovorus]
MVSLTVTILFFALVFAGIYFVYRMNRERALHRGTHTHMQTAQRRQYTSNSENQGRPRNSSENTRQL